MTKYGFNSLDVLEILSFNFSFDPLGPGCLVKIELFPGKMTISAHIDRKIQLYIIVNLYIAVFSDSS